MLSEAYKAPVFLGILGLLLLHDLDSSWKRFSAQKVYFCGQAGDKDVVRVINLSYPCMLRLFKRVFCSHSLLQAQLAIINGHGDGGCLALLPLILDQVNLLVSGLQQVIADLLNAVCVVGRRGLRACQVFN